MTLTLQEIFLSRAAKTPGAPAVITQHATISFGELASRAGRIANKLRSRKAEPEPLIGVCMTRSPDLAACLIGILEAGCAFVPLDPAQPTQRSGKILAQARPSLVIVDDLGARKLASSGCDLLHIEASAHPVSRNRRVPRSRVEQNPDGLAYVIYTSGSTGEPKGVEITHSAVLNTLTSINQIAAVRSDDRILNVSPVGFDLTVYDLFGAWAAGAAAVMPSDTPYPEPRDWVRSMVAGKVTVWNSAPALLDLLLDFVKREPESVGAALAHLRLVMLSGDRIHPALLRDLAQIRPGTRVLAMGGATEASIWSVHNFVEDLPPGSRFVPYGAALPNQDIRVMDSDMNEVAVGETGALFIGGKGLARAYRGRPDLTAAAFIPDPTRWGARLYSTGDTVRRLRNDNTEFIGRTDGQVKIRGCRVEIAEVERALLSVPGIDQAAVTHMPSPDGGQLCGHIVIQRGKQDITAAEIRTTLASELPVYMLPVKFHFLGRMPVTQNGKVDRGGLRDMVMCEPTPPARPLQDATTYVAPSSSGGWREREIARIWEDVLRVEGVAPSDHFLDLGGNSVLAAQIANRLSELSRVEIRVRDVFENPTITQLSAALAERVTAEHLDPGRASQC